MKKVFVELDLPELDKNDCDHLILQKVVSFGSQEVWQCVFCKTLIKQKESHEVQKKFQK